MNTTTILGAIGISGVVATDLGTARKRARTTKHVDTSAFTVRSSVATNDTTGHCGDTTIHVEASAIAVGFRSVALGYCAADVTTAHGEVTTTDIDATALVFCDIVLDDGSSAAHRHGAAVDIQAAASTVVSSDGLVEGDLTAFQLRG